MTEPENTIQEIVDNLLGIPSNIAQAAIHILNQKQELQTLKDELAAIESVTRWEIEGWDEDRRKNPTTKRTSADWTNELVKRELAENNHVNSLKKQIADLEKQISLAEIDLNTFKYKFRANEAIASLLAS